MIKGLDHAAIVVKDIERSIKFYCEVLGLQLNYDGRADGGRKLSFLGSKRESFIALEEDIRRGKKERGVQALDHLAFAVADVEEAHRTLKARGVNFLWERVDGDGRAKSYYFDDPDGLELEIYGRIKKKTCPPSPGGSRRG